MAAPERLAGVAAQLGEILVGEHEGEPVGAGLGEHVVQPVREGEEVVALVEVDRRVGAGVLAEAGAVGGRFPRLGKYEGTDQPGGVGAERTFGHPDEADPVVEHPVEVDCSRPAREY